MPTEGIAERFQQPDCPVHKNIPDLFISYVIKIIVMSQSL